MNELISIITPVYNSEKYIEQTIESVLAQDYTNWEMIIVDDCSTDDTSHIIQQFSDNRIQFYILESNQGAAAARNYALDKAKGRYIAFLDADDTWKDNKLSQQISFMERNGYGFTYTAYEMESEERSKIVHVPQKLNYSQFMKNTIIGTLTVIIDRNIVGDIRLVDIRKDHDSMTWAKILRSGHNAFGLDEDLATYRKVEGSISNNKFKAIKRHWDNMRQIEKIPMVKCLYYFCCYCLNAIKKHYL